GPVDDGSGYDHWRFRPQRVSCARPCRLRGRRRHREPSHLMRAVWSFWSTPYHAHYHRVWHNARHHLLSWGLLGGEACRHYPDTSLVTASEGAGLLVDRLALPFRHVDLRLDRLDPSCDEEWWVLGKLMAYAAQTAPFLHLDNDVVLWRPLPTAVTDA